MRRIINFVVLLILPVCQLQSQFQSLGQWKSFTDMKSVRSAVYVDGSIWAATSGGVFALDTASKVIKKYNNADGIASNDLRCIAAESGKRIWVGGIDGYISVYDRQTGVWSTIDARGIDRSQVGIQSLFLMGDTMYVAAVFGVMPFKINKWEFGDTYSTFGSLSSPVVTCIFVSDNSIFVGTDKGLAIASRTAPNLYSPDSWTTYSTIPGIASVSITALTVFKDTLVIATDKGLAYYCSDGSFGVVSSFSGESINDLRVDGDRLLVLRNESTGFIVESLLSLADVSQELLRNTSFLGSSLIPTSSLWIGTTSNGIVHQTASDTSYYYPNGPKSNYFTSLVADEKGVLWAASGSNTRAGFYRYDASLPENIRWKNFPVFGDGCYRASLGASGSVWISSWGGGVAEVVSDTIRRILNYYSNPSLPGTGSEPSLITYVVTGDVAVDDQGKTWIANRVTKDSKSLLRLDDDTNATFFNNRYYNDGYFHTMVIDRNGTKWLAGDLPGLLKDSQYGLLGIYLFNEDENFTLYGKNTISGWTYLSTADGLRSNYVFSLVVDLEGAVWIGTTSGISIVSDPQYPKQQMICYPLYGRYVQAIAVDAINNKWIGTNEGVFVVNSDGTQLLQTYDVASTNGKLLSNDIRSIAIDQTRGIAYFGFGAELGLSSLAISALQTNRSYTELEIGPNPFVLPNDQSLIIRNLTANSSIKILNVNGSVVAQFEAQGGGRAFWDGRNKNGVLVPSGIYFIVAFTENGSQTITGKVAVIRH